MYKDRGRVGAVQYTPHTLFCHLLKISLDEKFLDFSQLFVVDTQYKIILFFPVIKNRIKRPNAFEYTIKH